MLETLWCEWVCFKFEWYGGLEQRIRKSQENIQSWSSSTVFGPQPLLWCSSAIFIWLQLNDKESMGFFFYHHGESDETILWTFKARWYPKIDTCNWWGSWNECFSFLGSIVGLILLFRNKNVFEKWFPYTLVYLCLVTLFWFR